jgi:hypothetical protein
MNKNIIIISMVFLSIGARAYEYQCVLKNVGEVDYVKASFNFDTSKERSKYIAYDINKTVGCLQFDSQPPLLTCNMGEETSNQIAVTDLGSRILVLESQTQNEKLNLTCLKHE